MEIEAAELRAGADALNAAKDAVFAARAAVEAGRRSGGKLRRLLLRAKMRPREAHSQLTAVMKKILKGHHISVQRYWNATLVGPDVRRFLTAYVAILEALAAKNPASKGAEAAAEFTATHSRVLEQLQVVSHFTRTIDMLSTLEWNTLEHECRSFGEPLYAHGERPHRRAARSCVCAKVRNLRRLWRRRPREIAPLGHALSPHYADGA
jgi:hypothetical protein